MSVKKCAQLDQVSRTIEMDWDGSGLCLVPHVTRKQRFASPMQRFTVGTSSRILIFSLSDKSHGVEWLAGLCLNIITAQQRIAVASAATNLYHRTAPS